jgi:hypothetical protein
MTDDEFVSKSEYLASQIEQNPDDLGLRAQLVSHLVEDGRIDEAEDQIEDTLDECETTWPMMKEFHIPVADTLIKKGEVSSAQPLILHANKNFPEESRVKRMITKAEKALTQQMSASVFPSSMHVTDWWDGPHLISDNHLSEWIPGQIVEIDEDDTATIHVASLGEGNQFEEGEWEMPLSQIKDLSSNSPPDGDYLYSRLEIGIYNDESIQIKFHQD